jgi:aspartate racemase
MSAIGILGGMGPQASAHLVALLIQKTSMFVDNPTDSDFPEIIHLSVPVPNFISSKTNMQKAREILTNRTRLLEQAGSTINGIACNTAHLLLPELQAVTTVPFVSIPHLVAGKLARQNITRVGLLATPNTLSSSLFDDTLVNVEIIRPSDTLAGHTEELIFKLLANTLSSDEQRSFRQQVNVFLKENELEAVILGCTELPLVFGETTDPRVISTLDVLADGLLSRFFTASQ